MVYSNQHVDRSYHSSKEIREYQDRGMMKWQGFYLSEHTSAMKKWKEKAELPILTNELEIDEKYRLLVQSMLNRLEISLELKPGRLTDQMTGIVKELLSPSEVLLEITKDNFCRIRMDKIITIILRN